MRIATVNLMTMNEARPLSIPVILGTTRKGRMSAHAARFVFGQLQKRTEISSELIDIAKLSLPTDDAGEAAKDPRFSAVMERADAIVIVSPEYNHSFPGLLKHVLDTCLKEYIHKAAGIVGVSAGVFGGARAIEHFQPVLRELGLVSIFWDVNFGSIEKTFDANGQLLDQAYIRRTDKFLNELIWMAKVLRYGRENIPLD
jgi:NAD(P)H-dependent FMN reductase